MNSVYVLMYCYNDGCEKLGVFSSFEKAIESAKMILKRDYGICDIDNFHNSKDMEIIKDAENDSFEFSKNEYIETVTINKYDIDKLEEW